MLSNYIKALMVKSDNGSYEEGHYNALKTILPNIKKFEILSKEMLEALKDAKAMIEEYEKEQINHNGIGTLDPEKCKKYHAIKNVIEKAEKEQLRVMEYVI